MIFSWLFSLFGCQHKEYTFPMTDKGRTTTCCLSCGKKFEYDWTAMCRGKEVS